MKKFLSFCLFTFLLGQFSFAQTEVGGGIFEATSWTADQSPYVVVSDVVVFPDASLTIEPGVEIRFVADTKMELRAGDLYANGTADDPILLTLDSDNPLGAPKWNGIEYTQMGYDSAAMEFNYVIFEYAKTAINYGAGYNYRYINNAVFRYNDRGPFDGAQGYNWVTITDSEFIENIVGMEGRMSAINCTFTDNETGFGNPMTFSSIADGGGRVTNCTFTGNDLGVGTIGQIITVAVIENSYFENNKRGHYGYWANVDSTIVTGSTEVGVYATKGEIQNSLFSQNKVGLETSFSTSSLNIHDNFFTLDTVSLAVGDNQAIIVGNTLCNAIEYAAVSLTNQAVDLNQNCWCTTDLDEIAETVFDAYDDVSLGIIEYDDLNPNCVQGLVYPGDGNNNGIANAWDLINIGLAFGETGEARPNASTAWIGQETEDWATVLGNNVNAKHADTNGDGTVDFQDLEAISLNYNKIHLNPTEYQPVMVGTAGFEMYLDLPAEVTLGETVQVDVILATDNNPIDNLYGIAFAIESDVTFFEAGTANLLTSDSWLGDETNMMELLKEFQAEGRLEIGFAKYNQQPSSGAGVLTTLEFVMSEDIIAALVAGESGGNGAVVESLNLRITDIEAVTSEGLNIMIENEEQEILISNTKAVSDVVSALLQLSPNPASDYIQLTTNDLQIEKVTLFNSAGQMMKTIIHDTDVVELENLPAGLYVLRVQTNEGLGTKRFLIE